MVFFGFAHCVGFSGQVCEVKTSRDFEHPAWVQVVPASADRVPAELRFSDKMAVRAGASPSGKWLLVGTAPYSKPVLGEADGYSMLDRRGLEGSFDLALYALKSTGYKKEKSFALRATWSPQNWSKDERYEVLIGGPGMMIIEKLGPDRVFLLDTKTKIVKQIFAAPNVDEAKISGDGRTISIVKSHIGPDKVTKTLVVVSRDAKILSKKAMADHF